MRKSDELTAILFNSAETPEKSNERQLLLPWKLGIECWLLEIEVTLDPAPYSCLPACLIRFQLRFSGLTAVAPAVEVSTERWWTSAFKYRAAFSRDYQWMSITDTNGTIEVWQLPELKLLSSFHHGAKPSP